jgi:hypothetical protein
MDPGIDPAIPGRPRINPGKGWPVWRLLGCARQGGQDEGGEKRSERVDVDDDRFLSRASDHDDGVGVG